jgi:hypothetical protein
MLFRKVLFKIFIKLIENKFSLGLKKDVFITITLKEALMFI